MRVTRSVSQLRAELEPLRARGTVALVPTMGALHEGHLSLVRLARTRASSVVVSIFVNPLQFGPREDFQKYPRPLEDDLALLEKETAEIVFCPEAADFYPPHFSTRVVVGQVSEGQEGARRPGHFEGVATVVTKLFNCVRPDVAIFGRKDLQQLAVIRRLVEDLNFPVEIVAAPISREEDGLARSSRNVYLSAPERAKAGAFPRVLRAAVREISQGTPVDKVNDEARTQLEKEGFGVDYLETTDPETMRQTSAALPGTALVAAVRLGGVRLLDNILIGESGQ